MKQSVALIVVGICFIAASVGAITTGGRGVSQQGTFLQSGTGATLRTIESKERDVVSVKDFGAVCDSSTDNVTAFTNAAAYANANPQSTLYFPDCAGSNTYKYSGGLVFTQPVTLTGGQGAVLNYTGSSYAVKMGPDGLVLGTAHTTPYRVIGLTFTGGASSTQGIYFNTFITIASVGGTYFNSFGSSTGYAIFFQAQNWDARVYDVQWYAAGSQAYNFIRANGIDGSSVSDQGQTVLSVQNVLATNQSTAAGQVVGVYTNGAFSRILNDKIEGFAPNVWVGSNAGASSSSTKLVHLTLETVRGSSPCIMYGESSGSYTGLFTEDMGVEDSYCNVHNTDFATTVHFIGPAGASSGLQDAKLNNNLVQNLAAAQPIVVQNNLASQTGNQATGNRQGASYPDNPPKPLHSSGGNITSWGGFDGDLPTFANGQDTSNFLTVKAGSSAAQTAGIQFLDFNGAVTGDIECLGSGGSNRCTAKGPGPTNSFQFYSDGRFGFLKGIDGDSAGLKHLRSATGCATAAAAGATCDTTITWGTAFADANETPICEGFGITSGVPVNGGMVSKLAASVVFRTVAITAVAAQFTNIYCVAAHD